MTILSSSQEGESHVFARWSGIEYHHFDGGNVSLELIFDIEKDRLLIGLRKVKAYIEVILFFAVGFFKVAHDFLAGALYFCPGADDGDFFVFLLDVGEGVVHLFEWGLSADPELGDAWLSLERRHVIDNCLDFVGVEVKSFDLEGDQSLADFLKSTEDVFLSSLYQQLACDVRGVALFAQKQAMVVDGHLRRLFDGVDD